MDGSTPNLMNSPITRDKRQQRRSRKLQDKERERPTGAFKLRTAKTVETTKKNINTRNYEDFTEDETD